MKISPSMCGLSGRPLAPLNIDINISREPHIGRDLQTPAHIYPCSCLTYIAAWDVPCPLLFILTLSSVLPGLVIVTDEAPMRWWGCPGPGNDIMTGWLCRHPSHAWRHHTPPYLTPCPAPPPHLARAIGIILFSRIFFHGLWAMDWWKGKKMTNMILFTLLLHIAIKLLLVSSQHSSVWCSGQSRLLSTHTWTRIWPAFGDAQDNNRVRKNGILSSS